MEVYWSSDLVQYKFNALAVSRMKKTTRPDKTLASMKEGKGIDMSNPDIADEIMQDIMQRWQQMPKGTKDISRKNFTRIF